MGFGPKIRSKLACESKKSKVPVSVIDLQEVTTEQTRSIFGVEVKATADVLIGVKAGEMVEGATPVVKVETIGEE